MKERYKQSPRVVEAKRLRSRRGAYGIRPGELSASCWCQRAFVNVSEEDIRNGITASCGHKECRPS